jgi:hypothetical protein
VLDDEDDGHSISVAAVTLPLAVDPSASVSVSKPLVNDAIVPALPVVLVVGIDGVVPVVVVVLVPLGVNVSNRRRA